MEQKNNKKHLLIGIPTFILVIVAIILCCIFIPKACQKGPTEDNVILNVECINCTIDGQKELHKQYPRNSEVKLTFVADENCILFDNITVAQGDKKLIKDIDYTYSKDTGEFKFVISADTNVGVNASSFLDYTLTYRSPGTNQNIAFGVENGYFTRVDWGDGTINDSTEHTYEACTEGTTYYIKIFDFTASAFGLVRGHPYITSVNIPDCVRIIGIGNYRSYKANFKNCTALKSINFSSKSCLTVVQEYAFDGCSALTSFKFPSHVQAIGAYAFNGCSSLTSVRIPKETHLIEIGAFSACTSLESIVVDSENPNYDSRDNCNAIIASIDNGISYMRYKKDTLVIGCKNTVIPNDVKYICNESFYNCYLLTSINIPSSVISIGSFAFCNCSSLETVTLEDNSQLTSIGYDAFNYCPTLTSFTIPNGVTSIGSDAFYRINNNAVIDMSDVDHLIHLTANIFTVGESYLKFEGTIKVKSSLLETYKNADYWKNTANCFVGV